VKAARYATSSEAIFAALADPTRRTILEWLSHEGPATATELARRLPITRQAVVKHLRALVEAGVVIGAREGREVRYRLVQESMTAASRWIDALAARWDYRLDRLRSQVEARQVDR
jgi:DNA-binding transcriptional ArsR family regulator